MASPLGSWGLARLALELGFIIALPLLVFIRVGQAFDERWGTAPGFTIAGILVAMTASSAWLYRHLKPYLS